MGILKLFSKTGPAVRRLPAGSMTVDRRGNVVATTVSSGYPRASLIAIAGEVLKVFHEARAAHMPLSEIHLHFASLRITAREMRGGAIVFLSPNIPLKTSSAN